MEVSIKIYSFRVVLLLGLRAPVVSNSEISASKAKGCTPGLYLKRSLLVW
jgi:hypothetical protein